MSSLSNPASTSPLPTNQIRHLSQSSLPSTNSRSSATPLETVPTDEGSTPELTAVVDELLDNLSTKFRGVAAEMFSKMDDMSRRIDALEESMVEPDKGDGKGKGK